MVANISQHQYLSHHNLTMNLHKMEPTDKVGGKRIRQSPNATLAERCLGFNSIPCSVQRNPGIPNKTQQLYAQRSPGFDPTTLRTTYFRIQNLPRSTQLSSGFNHGSQKSSHEIISYTFCKTQSLIQPCPAQ